MGEKNFLEDYLSRQKGSSSENESGIEAILERETSRKTFGSFALSAVDFLRRNYNALVAAAIPASYYLGRAYVPNLPDLTLGIIACSAIAYTVFRKKKDFRVNLKKSRKGSISEFMDKNCFGLGFGISAAQFANAYKAVLLNRAYTFYPGKIPLLPLKNFIGGNFLKEDLGLLSIAFSAGLMYSAAMKMISSFNAENISSWKYLGRELSLELKGKGSRESLEKLEAVEEEKIAKGDDSRFSYCLLANVKRKLGKIDESFYYYSRLTESSDSGEKADVIRNLFINRIILNPLDRMLLKKSKNSSSSWDSIDNAFSSYYLENDLGSSLKNWQDAISGSNGEMRLKILALCSMFLSEVGKKKISEDTALELVEGLKKTGMLEKSLYEVPSSRNEVFEIGKSGFFKDALILKRNKGINPDEEEARIVSEYITSDFLTDLFRNKIRTDFRNISPIPISVFRDEDGRVYHLMKRSAGLNLRDYFENCPESEKGAALKRVMESSAIIHAYAIDFLEMKNGNYYIPYLEGSKDYLVAVPRLNYVTALRKRLIRRIGENPMLEGFMKEAEDYSHSIAQVDAFCHGDSYITNFLEDGSWIDLEKRVIANPMIDIAALLELPECEGLDKTMILEHYLSSFAKACPKKARDVPKLKESYIPSRIFFSLYNSGRAYSQDNPERASFFVMNAVSAMEENNLSSLLGRLYDYIISSGKEPFVNAIRKV